MAEGSCRFDWSCLVCSLPMSLWQRRELRACGAGKQMNDDKPVKDYNIEGGCVLHLVIALRGGC